MTIGPGEPAAGSFSADGIRANAPNRSGVYSIHNRTTWIYIGESEDIQERLLAHVSEEGTCIKEHRPTSFTFELCSASQRVARQDELILRLRPVCNQRFG